MSRVDYSLHVSLQGEETSGWLWWLRPWSDRCPEPAQEAQAHWGGNLKPWAYYWGGWSCGLYIAGSSCGLYIAGSSCCLYIAGWSCGLYIAGWSCGLYIVGSSCGLYIVGWSCGLYIAGWSCGLYIAGSSCCLYIVGSSCGLYIAGSSCGLYIVGLSCGLYIAGSSWGLCKWVVVKCMQLNSLRLIEVNGPEVYTCGWSWHLLGGWSCGIYTGVWPWNLYRWLYRLYYRWTVLWFRLRFIHVCALCLKHEYSQTLLYGHLCNKATLQLRSLWDSVKLFP